MTQKIDLYKFGNCKVIPKTRAVDKIPLGGSTGFVKELLMAVFKCVHSLLVFKFIHFLLECGLYLGTHF